MRGSLTYQLTRTFFGLSNEYEKKIFEQFHYMIYYGNWRLVELVSLPVGLRDFFFRKLKETKESEKEGNSSSTSAKEGTALIANNNEMAQAYLNHKNNN